MNISDRVTLNVSTARISLAILESIKLDDDMLRYNYLIKDAIKELKMVLKNESFKLF